MTNKNKIKKKFQNKKNTEKNNFYLFADFHPEWEILLIDNLFKFILDFHLWQKLYWINKELFSVCYELSLY